MDDGSGDGEWSPDDPSGSEPFEQGDEALSEQERLDPAFDEELEVDPSLDPALVVDQHELEELGASFDDPEAMATLEGGMDDPDGLGGPAAPPPDDEAAGWGADTGVDEGEPEP